MCVRDNTTEAKLFLPLCERAESKEMEGGNGKRSAQEEEAGPSASGFVPSKQEMTEKPFDDHRKEEDEEEADEDEEEEESTVDHKNDDFIPGPLLSLKEQIEKDKVLDSAIFCFIFVMY